MASVSLLALAATIIDLVVIGRDLVRDLKGYADATQDVPKSVQAIHSQLPVLLGSLERIRKGLLAGNEYATTNKDLEALVANLKHEIEAVRKIIDKIKPDKKDNPAVFAKRILSSLIHKDEVRALEERIQSSITVLILHQVTKNKDSGLKAIYDVPAKQITPFAPRDELIALLDTALKPAALSQSSLPLYVTLSGLKTAGKTQLALEYCKQAHNDGRFKTVMWVEAATLEKTRSRFAALASAILQSNEVFDTSDAKIDFLRLTLERWWHPWLLVLDNCDVSMLESNKDLFLPSNGCGAIICIPTTQSSKQGFGEIIEVKPYRSPEQSLALYMALMHAFNAEDVSQVELCLSQGADVNSRDRGWPILHRAAYAGNESMVRLLLAQGADPLLSTYGKNFNGINTALYFATESGHVDIANMLLEIEKAATMNGKINPHHEILLVAARKKRTDIVRLLLERGNIDINYTDSEKRSALWWAAYSGDAAAIEILLDKGVDPNQVDSDGKTPLLEAVTKVYWQGYDQGHDQVVEVLCKHKARTDIGDEDGVTPLHSAVSEGKIQLVEVLLKSAADVSVPTTKNGFYPLHYAARGGYNEIAVLLLDRGANVNGLDLSGDTPLMLAAKAGRVPIVELLLKQPHIDIQCCNNDQQTALSLAIKSGHANVMAKLLGRGANPNQPDGQGRTPLHLAVEACQTEQGKPGMIRMLLRRGASSDTIDGKGRSALLLAAELEIEVAVENLLAASKCNINMQDTDGNTALSWAAYNGHFGIVTALLKRGADRDIVNNGEDSPEDRARDGQYINIIKLLQGEMDLNHEEESHADNKGKLSRRTVREKKAREDAEASNAARQEQLKKVREWGWSEIERQQKAYADRHGRIFGGV